MFIRHGGEYLDTEVTVTHTQLHIEIYAAMIAFAIILLAAVRKTFHAALSLRIAVSPFGDLRFRDGLLFIGMASLIGASFGGALSYPLTLNTVIYLGMAGMNAYFMRHPLDADTANKILGRTEDEEWEKMSKAQARILMLALAMVLIAFLVSPIIFR